MIVAAQRLELSEMIAELVDSRFGIIRRVWERPRETGNPDFFYFIAEACDTSAFCPNRNFSITAGSSIDRDRAVSKAIGEAIERYCSAIYLHDELPLFSFASAPCPCIQPSQFALFSEKQYESIGFSYAPFREDTVVRWCETTDLNTGMTCFVPAAMVFIPYECDSEESSIVQPISTGLACHVTKEEAALNAICEVIERDAFTITWQRCISPRQIMIDSLDPSNRELVERFERTGRNVLIYDIRLDLSVPTVLSIQKSDEPKRPALVFAAAAALDPREAIRKSLEELALTGHYMQEVVTNVPRLVPDPMHSNIVDQQSHLNFWCDHRNRDHAAFMFRNTEKIELGAIANLSKSDPASDLRLLAEIVSNSGHRVLISDLTTRDVRDVGLSVVRALIPGFHPLFMGYRYRALGGNRLARMATVSCPNILPDNPAPHPYP